MSGEYDEEDDMRPTSVDDDDDEEEDNLDSESEGDDEDDDDGDDGDDEPEGIAKPKGRKRSRCPVFLSYQWDLQDTVKRLKSKLEERGIKCWMDIGQMGGGDALFAKIDAGIRGCKVFVCCVTEKYCQSETCQKEATLASSLKKPIIPLLFEDIAWPPEGQLSLIFTSLLYIKMTEQGGTIPDAGFKQLTGKVEEFVKP